MLLMARPEATSRPHETAISATTSARLIRPMRRLDEPRDSSFRISFTFAREAWGAGQRRDHAATSGAERGANRDLLRANGGAREEEVGHVGARDQHHAEHGAEHR